MENRGVVHLWHSPSERALNDLHNHLVIVQLQLKIYKLVEGSTKAMLLKQEKWVQLLVTKLERIGQPQLGYWLRCQWVFSLQGSFRKKVRENWGPIFINLIERYRIEPWTPTIFHLAILSEQLTDNVVSPRPGFLWTVPISCKPLLGSGSATGIIQLNLAVNTISSIYEYFLFVIIRIPKSFVRFNYFLKIVQVHHSTFDEKSCPIKRCKINCAFLDRRDKKRLKGEKVSLIFSRYRVWH